MPLSVAVFGSAVIFLLFRAVIRFGAKNRLNRKFRRYFVRFSCVVPIRQGRGRLALTQDPFRGGSFVYGLRLAIALLPTRLNLGGLPTSCLARRSALISRLAGQALPHVTSRFPEPISTLAASLSSASLGCLCLAAVSEGCISPGIRPSTKEFIFTTAGKNSLFVCAGL